MRDAFVANLEEGGFKPGSATYKEPDTYRIDGNSVVISWQNIKHSKKLS
jgi:predicted SnoaL-like aldol condensation-catalyzing enzyme